MIYLKARYFWLLYAAVFTRFWVDTPSPAKHPKVLAASEWSAAVADFIADPSFYRHVEWSQLPDRFRPLFESVRFDRASGTATYGTNRAKGIVWMDANLQGEEKGERWRILSCVVVMQRTDSEGRQLYPLVRRDLEKRLGSPWKITFEEGRQTFWRKGSSRYVISVDETRYESAGRYLDTGPFVVVGTGEEQGDSEEQ